MNIRKNIFVLTIFIIFVFSASLLLFAADKIAKVYVNGVKIQSVPIIKDGRACLPLSNLSSILKTEISYNPSFNTVKVYAKTLNLSAFTKNKIIYLPAKPVVEACGGSVSWNKYNRILTINTRGLKYTDKKPSTMVKIQPVTPTVPIKITPLEPTPKAEEPQTEEAAPSIAVPFIPRSIYDDFVKITVTDLRETDSVKKYKAAPGFILVSVYLSQENISNYVKMTYSDVFTLTDENNNVYRALYEASNFWLLPQTPGAINSGYLTFEIPKTVKSFLLIYQMPNRGPLAIPLR